MLLVVLLVRCEVVLDLRYFTEDCIPVKRMLAVYSYPVISSFHSNWNIRCLCALRLLQALGHIVVNAISQRVLGIACEAFHFDQNTEGMYRTLP